MKNTGAASLVHNLAQRLGAQLIETHISWVLLSGGMAYKIKKSVRLPFVDYSTLASRKFFCEEELRLNSRLAAPLYLGVTRITGTPQEPQLDGPGPVLDYAVRMRRFPDGALFSELLQAGSLLPGEVDALAALLSRFHQAAPVAAGSSAFGQAAARRSVALAALEGVASLIPASELQALRHWIEPEAAALACLWAQRRASGFVRECHGDLHLSNVVRLDGTVAAFDGIEFDPALRWIDVIDDVSFAIMDFTALRNRGFAFRLMNGWLDRTGDHCALPALRFSLVYRALVRAQVAGLRGSTCSAQARRYVDTARAWMQPMTPRLFITHGLPGSGKTFKSQQLLEREGAIRLRSDVERKRMFGLGMLEDSREAGLDLYTADATARTYERVFDLARAALGSGYPVVIDAAFLRRHERERALALATGLGVPLTIVACEAPPEVLRQRLRTRKGDASEADEAVLERLEAAAEPLSGEEQQLCRSVG